MRSDNYCSWAFNLTQNILATDVRQRNHKGKERIII